MKAHLINPPDPVPEHMDYLALCGKPVAKAKFAMFLDVGTKLGAEVFLQLNNINTCSDCLLSDLADGLIYGIVPGQESQDEAA